MKEEKMVYSTLEVQKKLGIGRNKIYSYLEEIYKTQKPFRVIKIGKNYRIPKKDFDAWINGCQIE